MKIIKNVILTLAVFGLVGWLSIGEATATTYFVSPNGNDNNPGTEAKSFKTIQKAADSVDPGDTVIVKDGIYTDTDGNNWIVNLRQNRGGTSDKWVTYRSQNKWGAVLDGQNNSTGTCWGIDGHYVRIEGFEVTGCKNGGFHSNHGDAQHVQIIGNHIHHMGRMCDTTAYGMGGGAFQGAGTEYFSYLNNVFHDNGRLHRSDGCNYPDGFFYDLNHDHGIYHSGTTRGHTLIANNLFYNHTSGWAITAGGSDIKIYNNTFAFHNPGRTGNAVHLGGDASNVEIINNIVYKNDNCAFKPSSASKNVVIKNNLIFPQMDVVCKDNYPAGFFDADVVKDNLFVDPLLVDADNGDFDLTESSPAIDAGVLIGDFDYDIDGTPRPQGGGWDIGAYEFGGTGIPPGETSQCSDGKDNDGDGFTDLDDPGCSNVDDDNEYNQPPSTDNSIDAYHTTAPITIDGLLSENAWNQAESISFSNPTFSDNLVEISTQWDSDNLYFAYEVVDLNIEALNQNLWQDDGAEIYLDTQNNKSGSTDSDDYHFMININDFSNPAGIDVRTVTTTGGYTMEIAIPWDLINTVPSQGKVMGLLLGNNDRDNGSYSQFDWPGLIETGNYFRPNLWGAIVLAGKQSGLPPGDCQGDLNEDGQIDVADLQLMVNVILGSSAEDLCADLDSNGSVDIVDLQTLVNRILGQAYSKPQCSDGNDNDGDGLIDLADPGCEHANDQDEFNSEPSSSCDYYASPSGGGNGRSIDSPFQIADFWDKAEPGDTLCLLDGVYRGSNSMIDPPDGLSGTASNRITVRALNDGKVTIDGQGVRQPMRLWYNDYFIIEGINAHSSNDEVVELVHADNNIIRRIVAWDSSSSIFGIHGGAEYNLIEDCAGWGVAKKVFSNSQGGNHTTFRRNFGRWTATNIIGPTGVYTFGYNTYHALAENNIATWDTAGNIDQPYSLITGGSIKHGSKDRYERVYGNIAYVLPQQQVEAGHVFWWHNGRYAANYDELVDNVAYIEGHGSMIPFSIRGNDPAPKGHTVLNATAIGGSSNTFTNSQTGNIASGKTFFDVYPPGQSLFVNDDNRGATICHRYVDGVLHDGKDGRPVPDPLWPWPMNERIKQALIQSGYDQKGLDGQGGTDLMALIVKMFGPIPDECLGI